MVPTNLQDFSKIFHTSPGPAQRGIHADPTAPNCSTAGYSYVYVYVCVYMYRSAIAGFFLICLYTCVYVWCVCLYVCIRICVYVCVHVFTYNCNITILVFG